MLAEISSSRFVFDQSEPKDYSAVSPKSLYVSQELVTAAAMDSSRCGDAAALRAASAFAILWISLHVSLAQQSTKTQWLPDNYPLPHLGNGYVSTPLFGGRMYVQDLFTKADQPVRIGLPSTMAVRIDRHQDIAGSSVNYTFNPEQGFFETVVTVQQRYWVRQRLYAHVRIPELFAMELEAQALFSPSANEEISIPIWRGGCHSSSANECVFEANGITFSHSTISSEGMVPWTKTIRAAEGNVTGASESSNRTSYNIALMWDQIPGGIILNANTTTAKGVFLTSISRNMSAARRAYEEGQSQFDSGVLYSRHRDFWGLRYNEGRVLFQGAPGSTGHKLQNAVFSSLYTLLSAIPSHPYFLDNFLGVGPVVDDDSDVGVSHSGRVRWEQEIYVLPPLLLLQPEAAELMIKNRVDQWVEATENACVATTGNFSYSGVKYPYETVTGKELWEVHNASQDMDFLHAVHVSGDVALALQEYVKAVPPSEWIDKDAIMRTASRIAEFHRYLVQRLDGELEGKSGVKQLVVGINRFLNDTTAPSPFDERFYVQFHTFTHAVASVALKLPELISRIGFSGGGVNLDIAELQRLADDIYFPRDLLTSGHLTSNNFEHPEQSCEPDVLLAYFPLRHKSFDMENKEQFCSMVEADLIDHAPKSGSCDIKSTYVPIRRSVYELAKRRNCPLSGLSQPVPDMLSVVQGDFHIIPEYQWTSPGESLVTDRPFTTSLAGHGAFLQGILNGYAGIQLENNRLLIDPIIPEGTQEWSIQALNYQGFVLNLRFSREEILITVTRENQHATLYIEPGSADYSGGNDTSWRVKVGGHITVKRSRIYLVAVRADAFHWSQLPWLFQSTSLPAAKYMPEVGNGHIATMVNSSWVHMNGLYNGEGPKSSRARIPSLVAFTVRTNHTVPAQLINRTYELNVREGIFTTTTRLRNPSLVITHEIFAHRDTDRLLAAHVTFSRPKDPLSHRDSEEDGPVEISFDNYPEESQLLSEDIAFEPTRQISIGGNQPESFFKEARGKTLIPELKGMAPSPINMIWRSTISNFVLPAGQEVSREINVYISSRPAETRSAAQKFRGKSYEFIKNAHIGKWVSYWDNGRIEVDAAENFELAQGLYGSLYFLLASLPNQQDQGNRFIGLSPGGLARGPANSDYSGHIFWDTETWMYPPILNLHPDQARLLLEARTLTLDAAKANAILYGYKGAKFAWESAYTGTETSPWPPSGEYEIHITGDIAFAVRQYLYVTDDKMKAIREMRLEEMAVEMAIFWQSRSTCSNGTSGSCSIIDVMPPDEYHFPISNSIYTNYVAKLSLELPAYVFRITNNTHADLGLWLSTAQRLAMPKSVMDGKEYHLEFDGYTPGVWHPRSNVNAPEIKQGDVILLGYPLDMDMSPELRKNDLDIYRKVTDIDGPAMTWGMFAVGYLELGNLVEADTLFERNYENIVQPFGVWSEVRDGVGALNFLTGMGGFLQAVINGYGGIRIREDHLALHPQRLPKTSKWSLIGYKHLGHQFNMTFDFFHNTMTIHVVSKTSMAPHLVLVVDSGHIYDLPQAGYVLTVRIEKSLLREYQTTDQFTNPGTDTSTPKPSTGITVTSGSLSSLPVVIGSAFTITTGLPTTTKSTSVKLLMNYPVVLLLLTFLTCWLSFTSN